MFAATSPSTVANVRLSTLFKIKPSVFVPLCTNNLLISVFCAYNPQLSNNAAITNNIFFIVL